VQKESIELIRGAYEAYAQGDLEAVLRLVDPDLEWTFLDPSEEHPEPQVCHGRDQLETMLLRQAQAGLNAELEEISGNGDRVMVVVRIPGIDARRARKADDRSFSVLTVHDDRIVALRDCRDRDEALAVAGIG
jgi:ketosteroid isomerase-like protein